MRGNLSRALTSISKANLNVLKVLRGRGSAWIVGGWVRDSLMGVKTEDMDIATTLTPEQIKSIFPRSIMVGASFGTVIVRTDSGEFDPEEDVQVTTLRSEDGYHDRRRPERVTFLEEGDGDESILEDLSRRDFTINSMAVDVDGNLIDPYGGLTDLSNGVLKTVGSAERRFSEDGLRVLRAFRFLDAGTSGMREMDESLEAGIRQAGDFLSGVSKERIGVEISKILTGENTHQIVLKMSSLGVLDRVFEGHKIDIPTKLSGNHLVNLALLFRKQNISSGSLSETLRKLLVLSKRELAEISVMHDCRSIKVDSSIESVRRFKALIPEIRRGLILDYLDKAGADLIEFRISLEDLENEEGVISPLIRGDRLAEVTGLGPGPRLGRLKDWLYRKQIERGLKTEEEVLSLLSDFDWVGSNHEDWGELQWP